MATDDKYDRQLRLWGSEGQRRLNTSRVCVLGSSGLSSEVLKNLVLPGLGFFSLVDDVLVKESDLGENFFVTKDDLGKPRAEVVKSYLLELNPDVQGESVQRSINEILSTPDFFRSYNLIVACQLKFSQIKSLSKICEDFSINLILAKVNGLLGYLRVYTKEHCIIESKPSDKEIFDLRLHKPFEELTNYAEGINLEGLDDMYHSHVPFVVILLKLIKEWAAIHNKTPQTYEEKQQFKAFIKSKTRQDRYEENFQEAANKAYLVHMTDELTDEIKVILNDPKSLSATSDSEDFWRCARSVNTFISQTGTAPVTGLFTDMTSDTVSYITLQNIYLAKAEKDFSQISEIYRSISGADADTTILKSFCRNLFTLEVIRSRSLAEEFESINPEVLEDTESEEYKILDWYLALRAFEDFEENNKRAPEIQDLEALQGFTERVGKKVELAELEEIVRFGHTELHCISALIAGAASQEAVKLVTKQYTPINNTFIFESVHSTAMVLNL